MAASDDLKAQVESLQETVSAQQDRIDKLEPDTDGVSRRGVLAGLAGVAGFGAAIPYMSQPAAAQAVGQIGSPTERVDVYGATGDFDALEANQTTISTGVIQAYNDNGYEQYRIDNFSGIFAAVNKAIDDGAESVSLPTSGIYSMGETLELSNLDGFAMRSPGAGKPTINTTSNTNAIDIERCNQLSIAGVKMSGNGGTAMHFKDGSDTTEGVVVEQCVFENYTNTFTTAGGANPFNSQFRHLLLDDVGSGFKFADAGIENEWKQVYVKNWSANGIETPNRNQRIIQCNFGSDQDPFNAILIGSASGGSANEAGIDIINCNFEIIEDGDGNLTGNCITFNSAWHSSRIITPTVKEVERFVNINDGGSNDLHTIQIQQPEYINTVSFKIDAGDIQNGHIHYQPYNASHITNDSDNRVVGTQGNGDPVVRADDGSAIYQITVDSGGSLSTTQL